MTKESIKNCVECGVTFTTGSDSVDVCRDCGYVNIKNNLFGNATNNTKGETSMNNYPTFTEKLAYGAGVAVGTTMRFAGKGWELAKEGTAKLAKSIKKHASSIAVGVAGAVVGGLATSSIGAAAVVGAGAAFIIMAIAELIKAKRKKQEINKKDFMVNVLGAVVVGASVPYITVYGMYYLVLAMYNLTLVSMDALIYALVLFLV